MTVALEEAPVELSGTGAPPQRWRWLRPFIPKRMQPYLRGFRKRIELVRAERLGEPFRTIYPYTQVHPVRQQNLLRLCELIEQEGVEGACVECGVLDGGTAALIAYATRASRRPVHLFDAWEGLPETTAPDGVDARCWTGEVVGSPRRVGHVMSKVGIDPARVVIHKGWFNDTFPLAGVARVALVHVDPDFYEPTRLCLEKWYPLITPGGYMQFDDYSSFRGYRQAVDEFLRARPELPLKSFGRLEAKAYYFQKPVA